MRYTFICESSRSAPQLKRISLGSYHFPSHFFTFIVATPTSVRLLCRRHAARLRWPNKEEAPGPELEGEHFPCWFESNPGQFDKCAGGGHYRRPARCGFDSHELNGAPDRDPGVQFPGRTPQFLRVAA